MVSLDDLRFIDALGRTGSLSAAARLLNVTPPALSMRLKRLEEDLEVRLVVRSPRRTRLTSEGESLAAEARSIVGRVEELPRVLNIARSRLGGPLRIVAPFGFGRAHIAPLVAEFTQAHPSLRPELHLSDTPWKASDGADVVIHIGELRDSSWVAHLLARNERWICASPKYLAKHGTPDHPRQLIEHACLTIQENEEDVTLWHYRRRSREPKTRRFESVRITPILRSNDGEVVRNWAVTGLGCVLRSEWDVLALIRRGNLVRILEAFEFQPAHITALVPEKRDGSARVEQFVRYLKSHFSRKPPWRR
jgi:DNA-binding transcriptional LysR family regulator